MKVLYYLKVFGYLAPLKSELKVREMEVYNAYYCAICHAVKRRYGELPRLMLSYDAVLIAMLSAALSGGTEALSFSTFRCFNNPLKKRDEAAPSKAIDYAADVMVLLGWYGLKDGKDDRDQGNPLKSALTVAGEAALRNAGLWAAEKLGDKARICDECLSEQRKLEISETDSLDRVADPTGRLMETLLDFKDMPELSSKLRKLGYHLGRYIYIIDAADDLEKDRKSGAYNPLLLRPETPENLKTAIVLDLAGAGEILKELPLKYHKTIIDNIIYLGLRAKVDEVLA